MRKNTRCVDGVHIFKDQRHVRYILVACKIDRVSQTRDLVLPRRNLPFKPRYLLLERLDPGLERQYLPVLHYKLLTQAVFHADYRTFELGHFLLGRHERLHP